MITGATATKVASYARLGVGIVLHADTESRIAAPKSHSGCFICLTSKMSHGLLGRGSCLDSDIDLRFHVGNS